MGGWGWGCEVCARLWQCECGGQRGWAGGGARARFIISRLIAPVQEKSGSLGNRMPFSFNCQPPRTVNPPPPQVLHQRDPRGPTPAHQQRRAAVSYCTRITGQRRMRGACTQRHLMAPEEAGKRAPAAARSTSVCSLDVYTEATNLRSLTRSCMSWVMLLDQKRNIVMNSTCLDLCLFFSNAKENSVISFALQKTTTSKGPRFAHFNLILFVF